MRKVFPIALVSICSIASAADWLGIAPTQPKETVLNASNVQDLKLVWTYKLDAAPTASPIILGHWITNRGTKELLFIAAGRNVYAIDGDLGRLFWKRSLPSTVACLALRPSVDAEGEGDDDDDKPQTLRPLLVRLSTGKRIAIHPTHGGDIPAPAEAACGTPAYRSVAASGVIYRAQGKHLSATDASTRKPLYSSGALVKSPVSTGLAVANGHVCFGTADGIVYCFGFPVDQ